MWLQCINTKKPCHAHQSQTREGEIWVQTMRKQSFSSARPRKAVPCKTTSSLVRVWDFCDLGLLLTTFWRYKNVFCFCSSNFSIQRTFRHSANILPILQVDVTVLDRKGIIRIVNVLTFLPVPNFFPMNFSQSISSSCTLCYTSTFTHYWVKKVGQY